HALAPVIEMAVRLERVSDAAVYLQVLACGHLEASYSRQARGGGGGRQIVRRRFRRPSAIIGVRARKLGRHRNIGELVLDSLKAPEWATEYLAIHRIVACHAKTGIGSADCFKGCLHRGLVDKAFEHEDPGHSLCRRTLEIDPVVRAELVETVEPRPLH